MVDAMDDVLRPDSPFLSTSRGIRVIKISLATMALTTALEGAIALASGSVGLLADTIHNFADLFTTIPLWLAFALARRSANRTFTYGYSRAEDLAGIGVILVILVSAGIAGYEAFARFRDLTPPTNLGWAMLAALVSFVGNEAVAQYRARAGRALGSAALIADGEHARADGITALAALAGLIGTGLGFPQADPLAGGLIALAIVYIAIESGREVLLRALDAIDPQVVAQIERAALAVDGVRSLHAVRARWLGHAIVAEVELCVDETLRVAQGHAIAEEVRHTLLHRIARMEEVIVHVDAYSGEGPDVGHFGTAHHRARG